MIIFRNLAKEITATLSAVTSVLLLIFLSNQFVRYLGMAASGRLPGAIVFRLMMIQIPHLLGLLLPLGLFLGVLLVYGRLYAESEMTVMRACGLSSRRLLGMTMTVAFVSMLLGLGIDYGVHLLGRFQEERYIHNKSLQQSIEVALSKTGVGVTEGAITTSVAFFCMMISDFRGIQELGIITGGGILLIALVMLIFMPSGLCLLDRWTHKKHKFLQHHQNLVLEFHTSSKQKPSLVWGACFILLLGIILFGWGLRQVQHVTIDYNLLNLQDASLDSVKYEHILAQENFSSTMFAVAKAKNKAEAKNKTKAARHLADKINIAIKVDYFKGKFIGDELVRKLK